MALHSGDSVDRYLIEDLLGAGAMGEVYRATDAGLGRKVALKILADVHRDNDELRARFVREARAVAAIQHPNVVQVFTTGDHDGLPFLAMEYLSGRDLGGLVRELGPLDSLATARVLRDAASGLAAAADAGLIHRDVKPSNLVRLDPTGVVKVTDFGLAKPRHPGPDPGLTALGIVVGTPDYIAPEQARGEPIDPRVDVYALGCTAFFLITGRPPFREGNEEDDKYLRVVARHLRDPVPDPREEADVDDELAELVMAMMRKTPAARPDHDEVVARAQDIITRLGGSGPRRLPSVAPAPAPPADASMSSLIAEQNPTPRWLWPLTLLSALLLAAGLTAPYWLGSRAPEPVPVAIPGDAGPLPDGMLPVAAEGRAAFLVARRAVTHREYAARVPRHRFTEAEADLPVTGISWWAARNFASAQGCRLLTDAEWTLARDTPGFAPAGMRLWEWLATDQEGDDRPVRGVAGSARRPPRGNDDVTFRLAADPPP